MPRIVARHGNRSTAPYPGATIVAWCRSWSLLLLCMSMAHALAASELSFNRDIRPLLAANCFQCHGPDEEKREADLRLDTRAGAIAEIDGHAAIVPGKPESSELIARVTSDDDDLRMPPADSGKRLTAEQIELLRQWIAAGADYETHWAFVPVVRPPLPEVRNTDWPHNAVDYFVLQPLEARRIRPSPEADRYTLVRRVYLDFLGLPPSIAEVDEFVGDARPDAYERLIERVLASPRFGERWGRYWLDQARYADSHGYTNDNERIMWPYRDWVIGALNSDLPFDQFTIEQLAGDLLPQPSLDQLIATGFHRNTLINTEGGVKADQFHDEQVKDRVDTTGGVWLGLTIGCAKCHTHKYDPVSLAEYYQLYAFFNTTADRNSITPTVAAPSPDQSARLQQLAARQTELKRQLAGDSQRASRQLAWEQQVLAAAQSPVTSDATETDHQENNPARTTSWKTLELDGQSKQDAAFHKLADGSLLVSGKNVAGDEYYVTGLSPLTTIRSVRLEALKEETLPAGGPGRASNGNFVLSEIWFRTGDGRELRFSKATADHSQPGYAVAGSIDGEPNTGWAINGSPEGGANHPRTAWFVLPAPLEVEENHALTFTLQFNNNNAAYNLGRFRLSISAEEWIDTPTLSELAKLVAIPSAERTAEQKQRIDEAFLQSDPQLGPVQRELQVVTRQRDQLAREIPTVMILRELETARPTHVQVRGDFLRLGPPVDAGVPGILPPLPPSESRRTRLDLAQWLTRPDHPLTPRVQVNRLWMRLFGSGLVETENDFGTQGTLPTHPQLLDWLASEFVRGEWSTKQLLRTIALSATYRQASHARPDLAKLDPQNKLLARQSRLRVEGEIVRDVGLAVAGLLSNKLGGPGVYPPQPEGVYAFTQRAKIWTTSIGEDRYRRGLYTFFYRSAPYPMLTTFDAPAFNTTCTRRDRSNTPLQSLTVANSEAMLEIAQQLARRVLVETVNEPADTARVELLFRLCLARPPLPAERSFLVDFAAAQRVLFREQPEDAAAVAPVGLPTTIDIPEAAAWTATARVLLNLDEVITRE